MLGADPLGPRDAIVLGGGRRKRHPEGQAHYGISQAAHCTVSRSRASSQPLSCPQAGQRNPSGQRFSSSQRAQAASSGNRASNSGSDRGSSAIPFSSHMLRHNL